MPDPIIIVKFEKGLADRHRLPLSHVLLVLEEIRQMISSVGRVIQRQNGAVNASGDFGLEIVAGKSGAIFKKGSLQTPIAITRDIPNGLLAANSVLNTVDRLNHPTRKPNAASDLVEQRIVRHLDRIAKIQQSDHIQTKFTIKNAARPDASEKRAKNRSQSATFGDVATRAIREVLKPAFTTEHLTLFGRLYELKDRNQEQDSKRFWGELRLDNGERWRVQFNAAQEPEASRLFRKQVQIDGKAFYYVAHAPRIVVASIQADEVRDYEVAFDELFGTSRRQFDAPLDQLLREMHGEV